MIFMELEKWKQTIGGQEKWLDSEKMLEEWRINEDKVRQMGCRMSGHKCEDCQNFICSHNTNHLAPNPNEVNNKGR